MNQDIKAQWLQALRSGEYEQGRSRLHKSDSFCCLGVLCDLAAKEGKGLWKGVYFIPDVGPPESEILPRIIVEWAGLTNPSPEIDDTPLTVLNDGTEGHAQHTFAEIADLIEAHL